MEAASEQTVWDVIGLYLQQGYIHILPRGLDHILFVLALFFASTRMKPLIWQISAFTLAHTITLGLAVLGYVSLDAAIVEPIIALSIAFVAIENLVFKDMPRWRPAIVFAFGLFHGLGFAGVLTDYGLPQDQILPSLLSFNVGVEAGQLSIIAACWLALHRFADAAWYPWLVRITSGAIALMALWWSIERVFLGG
ncbi:HupE/UreJ family protein [Maricaulis maris]|uniref:HupE/UreJ family protein n=1 Tax=Maricaulis maris TaxID=74318 RepID=UPI003B8BCC53